MHTEDAVRRSLSEERLHTFDCAVAGSTGCTPLELYMWNARISAAFMVPLHMCEVVTRNAVSDALTRIHGPRWPWIQGFEDSLPSPASGYDARRELRRAAARSCSTATLIPTMSFVFWQKMFTHRFDARLWSRCGHQVYPGMDRRLPLHRFRADMHYDLEQIRRLRNRIAHHEPIFGRALVDDLAAIQRVVGLRCPRTAVWMDSHDIVKPLLRNRPG